MSDERDEPTPVETTPAKIGRPSKFNTPELRRMVFNLYKEHRSKGYSRDSFPEMSPQSLLKMVGDHPSEFDSEEIESIERNYLRYWEGLGIEGAQGAEKFNAPAWIFNMKNRAKWSDRNVLASDSENPFDLRIKLVE